MQRFMRAFMTRSSLMLLLFYAFAVGLCRLSSAAAQSVGEPAVYLDQGWSQADREMFYQTPQGSRTISYDIFLNLEVADGRGLFRADENSERYGLIPQSANRSGPIRMGCQ